MSCEPATLLKMLPRIFARLLIAVVVVPIEFATGGIGQRDPMARIQPRRKLYGRLYKPLGPSSNFVDEARKHEAWQILDGGLFRLGFDDGMRLVSRSGWVSATVECCGCRTSLSRTVITLQYGHERLFLVASARLARHWLPDVC
jgi:hypothetical protein